MDSSGNRDIYVVDLEHPVPKELTFDSAPDDYPLWSPDGRRIAFSRDLGKAGLFEVNPDDQGSERELSPPDKATSGKYPHSYTRDGRTLLVSKWPTGGGPLNGGIFTLSLDGDRLVEFLDTPTNEAQPRLSPPDNRWVAYMSLVKGGAYEVYVERYPSRGGKTQVSNGALGSFRWRPDGGELFYVGRDNHLMAVPMKDGGRTSLPASLFDHEGNAHSTSPGTVSVF